MKEVDELDLETQEIEAAMAKLALKKKEIAAKKVDKIREAGGEKLKESMKDMQEFHDLMYEKAQLIERT